MGPRETAPSCLAVLAVAAALAAGCGEDRIPDDVRAGTVAVGGLDADAARERVRRRIGQAVRRPVTVTHRSRRFVLRPDLAGVRLDVDATVDAAREASPGQTVAPRVSTPRAELDGFARRVARRVQRRARDADIDVRDGKLTRTRARSGLQVDRAELVAALRRAIAQPAATRRTVKLPTREGIHGTKDIASLGSQASHGCIRMSPTAVKQLFRQVKVGTPVFLQ